MHDLEVNMPVIILEQQNVERVEALPSEIWGDLGISVRKGSPQPWPGRLTGSSGWWKPSGGTDHQAEPLEKHSCTDLSHCQLLQLYK